MMPINKFSITKGHPGSQKEAAKSCNHTTLQYPLQKVQKHNIFWLEKNTQNRLFKKIATCYKNKLECLLFKRVGLHFRSNFLLEVNYISESQSSYLPASVFL